MPPTKPETEAEKMSVNRWVGLWQHTHREKIKEERNEIEGRRISLFLSVFMPLLPFYFRRGDILFCGELSGRRDLPNKKDLHDVRYILSLGNTQILFGIA